MLTGSVQAAPMAAQLRAREPEVVFHIQQQLPQLIAELSQDTLSARVTIQISFGNFRQKRSAPSELG